MYSVEPTVKIEPQKIRVYSNIEIVPAQEEIPTENTDTPQQEST
jgi:hypothetical protein